MISKKDKALLDKAFKDFLILADKNLIGDDFRPIFRIALTFMASGYNDVEMQFGKTYSTDMLEFRKDL